MNSEPGVRSAVLPVDHLDAELVAAPLVADAALRAALVSLAAKVTGDTAALWRETELSLLSRFPGTSVDELVIRRDRAWFDAKSDSTHVSVPLHEFLNLAAKRLLKVGGGQARPLAIPNAGSAALRRRWRWMTFALPPDLLLAAAGASFEDIALLSPNLATLLYDRGFAETHLHLKAAIAFPTLWASSLRAIAEPDANTEMFASPGAGFDEGRLLGPWLLRAALARFLLARFLRSSTAPSRGWTAWLHGHALPALRSHHGAIAIDLHLQRALTDLEAGQIGPDAPAFGDLRPLYSELTGLSRQPRPRSLAEVPRCDPISNDFLPQRGIHPEMGFLSAVFAHLDTPSGSRDSAFARLFWQVVRFRVTFYRHVVQRPMTPGLQWFTRTYARLAPGRVLLPISAYVQEAARLAGPGLRSLEVRITSERDMPTLSSVIDTLDRAAQDMRRRSAGPTEFGLVIHYPRIRGAGALEGRPAAWGCGAFGDPDANPSGYRFSKYYIGQRTDGSALGRLLVSFPRMLEVIRGADLCTDELGVPLWAVRPLVEHVRESGERAARRLAWSERNETQPVRLTVHAGEDWVHLLGGIRRVGEVVEFLSLGEGDRIGHGVALGVDPVAWGCRVGELPLPRGERLMDLLWAWRVAIKSSDANLRTWLPWLHEHLNRLSAEIFGGVHLPEELDRFVRTLHSTPGLRRAGFPSGPRPRATVDITQELVLRWLTGRGVFRRAQALEEVDVRAEIALVVALQAHVRHVLGRLGITVEINPSSNLLIGHLGALTSHPMWRLRPPGKHQADAPPVHVCIGSDDPITFATRLSEEYQLLLDAMVDAGLSSDEAEAWLEEARARGLTGRFTVPRSNHPLTQPTSFESAPLLL